MDKQIEGLRKYLPEHIYNTLLLYDPVNEIRLHKDKNIVIVSERRNIITYELCTRAEFSDIIDKFCNHSLHAYAENINEGYITSGNYRIGVCGKITNGNINEITSLNIRVPHMIRNISGYISDILRRDNYQSGILIYSPPAVGKTTVLRDLIITLSDFKRISVIDSRNELYDEKAMISPLIDVFNGYTKESAIEIAIRTMSPEYIICDEIGAYNECTAILSVQNTGVPLIASAHAADISDLIRRPNIKLLHDNMIFKYYVKITRSGKTFDFNISKWEDIG